VANGYGITLLPEMAISSEIHRGGDIRLLRFAAPEPKREIGLAWRKTSPRKAEFVQFGELLRDVLPAGAATVPSKTFSKKGGRKR
jgi:LysR family transcriptional regulator, hydrogen peroxide-inducible genes activator